LFYNVRIIFGTESKRIIVRVRKTRGYYVWFRRRRFRNTDETVGSVRFTTNIIRGPFDNVSGSLRFRNVSRFFHRSRRTFQNGTRRIERIFKPYAAYVKSAGPCPGYYRSRRPSVYTILYFLGGGTGATGRRGGPHEYVFVPVSPGQTTP